MLPGFGLPSVWRRGSLWGLLLTTIAGSPTHAWHHGLCQREDRPATGRRRRRCSFAWSWASLNFELLLSAHRSPPSQTPISASRGHFRCECSVRGMKHERRGKIKRAEISARLVLQLMICHVFIIVNQTWQPGLTHEAVVNNTSVLRTLLKRAALYSKSTFLVLWSPNRHHLGCRRFGIEVP